jgi:alkanesulfonate monooxygenase SsuD/methylene tetrahydromethanopterin reductase-like flavin-dependent oxidoreductase (luciferase family)
MRDKPHADVGRLLLYYDDPFYRAYAAATVNRCSDGRAYFSVRRSTRR